MNGQPGQIQGGSNPIDSRLLPESADPDDSVSVAAIYARTSESKPKFHYSINEQVTECWMRCEQMGWSVSYVFTDEDETGRNTDRPGFRDMLRKAEAGCFDIVIFWKLDRFCRSLVDLVRTEERLSEYDVALQSVTEYIDTASPVGRFNFRNLASAAELESDLTSQRAKLGMRGLARSHRWPNNNPPLGYSLKDDRTLEIEDEEAKLVNRIFELYLREKSMPRVALLLNREGLTTKGGDDWSRWTVRKVLSNELYKGVYQLADFEEYVEEYQIIPDDLFEEVTETRFRYRHSQSDMEGERKAKKKSRILSTFKQGRADS